MLVSAASRRVPVPFERYWDPKNCAKNFSQCVFSCKNVMTQCTFYYMEYSKDTSETKKNFSRNTIMLLLWHQPLSILKPSVFIMGWIQILLKHSYTNFNKIRIPKKSSGCSTAMIFCSVSAGCLRYGLVDVSRKSWI